MSITSAELARAGKAGLDFYLKNNPIDMVDIQRPLRLLPHRQLRNNQFYHIERIFCLLPHRQLRKRA